MARRRSAELIRKTADIFHLPGEALAGEPRVTVAGTSRVHVENHRGLLEYDGGNVTVNARGLIIKITGEDLVVEAMSDMELVVRGHVRSVEYRE